MRNGRETIWDGTESGRIIEYAFDRLLAEDYNAIVALLVGQGRHDGSRVQAGSETDQSPEHEPLQFTESRRSENRGQPDSFYGYWRWCGR
jgi:hypothetical protein